MLSFDDWFAQAKNKELLTQYLTDHNQDRIYLKYDSEFGYGYFSFPPTPHLTHITSGFPGWLKKHSVSTPMHYFSESMMMNDKVPLLNIQLLNEHPDSKLDELNAICSSHSSNTIQKH